MSSVNENLVEWERLDTSELAKTRPERLSPVRLVFISKDCKR